MANYRFQKGLERFLYALLFIALGLLWILSLFDVDVLFHFTFNHFWSLLLTGAGVIILIKGLLDKGNLNNYFGTLIIILGLSFALPILGLYDLTFAGVLPLVLAAPAAASFVVFLTGHNKIMHLKYAIFFGVLAIYCALNNFGIFDGKQGIFWAFLAVIAGIMIFCNLFISRGRRWDDADNEKVYREGRKVGAEQKQKIDRQEPDEK
jgi:hypothetical protein